MEYRKIPVFTLIVLLGLSPLAGQTGTAIGSESVEKQVEIDWNTAVLTMVITASLPDSDVPPPLVKHQVLQNIDRDFPGYLRQALLPLTLDSYYTFGDAVKQNPDLIHTVNNLAHQAELISSRMNLSLSSLIMEYRVPLLPLLLKPFVAPAEPSPLKGIMTYEPSGPFTGVVIYASGLLPVYGERDEQGMTRMEEVTPCFMPKILNEGGYTIFSSDNMDPASLETRGTASYIQTTDPEAYSERAGEYPFYTTARGLFGKNHTDIILSEEDIRRLLSREENHRLLQEGRIVIIY